MLVFDKDMSYNDIGSLQSIFETRNITYPRYITILPIVRSTIFGHVQTWDAVFYKKEATYIDVVSHFCSWNPGEIKRPIIDCMVSALIGFESCHYALGKIRVEELPQCRVGAPNTGTLTKN